MSSLRGFQLRTGLAQIVDPGDAAHRKPPPLLDRHLAQLRIEASRTEEEPGIGEDAPQPVAEQRGKRVPLVRRAEAGRGARAIRRGELALLETHVIAKDTG